MQRPAKLLPKILPKAPTTSREREANQRVAQLRATYARYADLPLPTLFLAAPTARRPVGSTFIQTGGAESDAEAGQLGNDVI